jgi:iron(III) transport system permease protein
VFLVLASLLSPRREAVAHISTTTGPEYLLTTSGLLLLVAAGVIAIGVAGAALVALCEFPGRRIATIALALPFAVPAYVLAYVYGDLTGPFGLLRQTFGSFGRADIRNLWGAAFILTLATYPYVYLAARASFAQRSSALLEAARTLGASPFRAVLAVLAPAGRAAIAGGLALALMETIGDFGVAEYFGVPTLSVGIFRTWRGLGDFTAALQLAAGLFLIALVLVLLEEGARRGAASESARAVRAPARLPLKGVTGALASALCLGPPLFGFALPVVVLGAKLLEPAPRRIEGLIGAAADSAATASLATAATLLLASLFALALRGRPGFFKRAAVRIATLGYAIPGAVLAVGVIAVGASLKAATGIVLAGAPALLYAYVSRFATAAFNAVDGGLKQIHPLTDEAARSLGADKARMAREVLWPLAKPSLIAGALIVFIDVSRELPATLLLRPFNFETLATEVYRLASDEKLAEAAPAALALIAIGLMPTLALNSIGAGRIQARTD